MKLAAIAIMCLAGVGVGCGSSGSSAQAGADSGSPSGTSDATEAHGGDETNPYPQGLCGLIPTEAIATALDVSESDVGACNVTGGDPSPAAGASLQGSGKYELYTLFLSPDEDGSLWQLASQGADLYELQGRQCFSSLNKGADGAETASVQCGNPNADNDVTFSLTPIAGTPLPSNAVSQAEAAAEAIFPRVFAYRGEN